MTFLDSVQSTGMELEDGLRDTTVVREANAKVRYLALMSKFKKIAKTCSTNKARFERALTLTDVVFNDVSSIEAAPQTGSAHRLRRASDRGVSRSGRSTTVLASEL